MISTMMIRLKKTKVNMETVLQISNNNINKDRVKITNKVINKTIRKYMLRVKIILK